MKPVALRALLIEDNPTDVLLLTHALEAVEQTTFTIEHATRLADGLARIAAADPPFDCILLDLSLPDETGLRTVQRAYEAAPHIPIVILTGLDDHELPFKAIRAGAQDYVTKETVDGPTLEHAILCALQRQQILNQPGD